MLKTGKARVNKSGGPEQKQIILVNEDKSILAQSYRLFCIIRSAAESAAADFLKKFLHQCDKNDRSDQESILLHAFSVGKIGICMKQ